MKELKIVFTGTMGAGKTTAIAAISDRAPVMTDVQNTDPGSAKPLTTVGLDYGEVTLEGGEHLRLFGTPGQSRFDFLWRILARNALGLVILVDNTRPDPLADLQVYLDGFGEEIARMPCVIGVGRTGERPSPGADDYADHLARRNLLLPVLEVDVRRRDDVLLLVDTLLAQIPMEDSDG
jgi:signal recognition particle receptor subunit beta